MKPYILIIMGIFILACGTSQYVATNASPATQNANSATPYWTSAPETPIRFVSGCWNIRETPAGKVVDAVCNGGLRVYGLVDGWMKIDQGYICPRAFGDEAECEVK